MSLDFRARLLALAVEDSVRRQLGVGAHHPRLQPNGLPLVFVEGDIASGSPAWIYSAAEAGPLMRIGRVVAVRTASALRIKDLHIFQDLDQALYLPAVVAYFDIEAGLFDLDHLEVATKGPHEVNPQLPAILLAAGYRPVRSDLMRKSLGVSAGTERETAWSDT